MPTAHNCVLAKAILVHDLCGFSSVRNTSTCSTIAVLSSANISDSDYYTALLLLLLQYLQYLQQEIAHSSTEHNVAGMSIQYN